MKRPKERQVENAAVEKAANRRENEDRSRDVQGQQEQASRPADPADYPKRLTTPNKAATSTDYCRVYQVLPGPVDQESGGSRQLWRGPGPKIQKTI